MYTYMYGVNIYILFALQCICTVLRTGPTVRWPLLWPLLWLLRSPLVRLPRQWLLLLPPRHPSATSSRVALALCCTACWWRVPTQVRFVRDTLDTHLYTVCMHNDWSPMPTGHGRD